MSAYLLKGRFQLGGQHQVREAERVARDVGAAGEVRLQPRQGALKRLRRGAGFLQRRVPIMTSELRHSGSNYSTEQKVLGISS